MKTIRGSTSTFMMDANDSQSNSESSRIMQSEQISEIRTDGVAYAVD